MDTVFIRDFRLNAVIGVYDWEREAAQPLRLDLEIGLPHSRSFESDAVTDTIDYAAVVERIRAMTAKTAFFLVETLAERITRLVREEFGAPWVQLSIAKEHILPGVAAVGVRIERGTRG